MHNNKIKRVRNINYYDTPMQNRYLRKLKKRELDDIEDIEINIGDRVGETNGVDANEEIDNRDNN